VRSCTCIYGAEICLAHSFVSVFSFFPPSTTIRCYQRASLATSSTELGSIYCSIVSYANDLDRNEDDTQRIMQSLIAIRSKLKRSLVLRTNVIYEVNSTPYRVPSMSLISLSVFFSRKMADRTIPKTLGNSNVCSFLIVCRSVLKESCSEAGFLLSHLMSVVERLEPAWCHAFLRRTRLLDADFQGDVLSVISKL
jgi:hypothetical protein